MGSRFSPKAFARLGCLVVIVATLSGCAPTGESSIAAPPPEKAEAIFRSYAGGLFRVESYRSGQGWWKRFENAQSYRWWLYVQPFEATVTMLTDIHVRSMAEMEAREREPGWSIEESEIDLERQSILGPGDHPKGSSVKVSTNAVFEQYGSTWRLVAFDKAGVAG